MLYIHNLSTNPFYNLALEEYLLKQKTEDYFLTWRNEPTVVVGKNQRTENEVNLPYTKVNNIHVVRRLTGGGAVYHDLENLNFTYIAATTKTSAENMVFFSTPILDCLQMLGIHAELSGRNDITIAEKKISGSAQYYYRNRLIHHGTLLVNSDLSNIDSILHMKKSYQQKGISSVQSRVTNVASHLKTPLTISEIETRLVSAVSKQFFPLTKVTLTPSEITKIHHLAKEKYALPTWTYSNLPEHTCCKIKTFPGGTLSIYLTIETGKIQDCRIYGDFFTTGLLETIENKLIGCPYQLEVLNHLISPKDIDSVFVNISHEEFMSCLF